MCGRAYSTFTDEELQFRYKRHAPFEIPVVGGLKPNFNFSPSQMGLVIRHGDEERGEPSTQLELMRWGLVPFWAKDIKINYSMINARSESIDEKPAFKNAFRKRRCIVPLSGFIEWKREGEGPKAPKRPFKIFQTNTPIMSAAGIWESWRDKEAGKDLHTFSIITTRANKFMAQYHDRMPVILTPDEEDEWLDPHNSDPERLKKFLEPLSAECLGAVEVSTLINSPKNNSPEVLEPLR